MKKASLYGLIGFVLVILVSVGFIFYENNRSDKTVGLMASYTINMASPANGAVYKLGDTIRVAASVSAARKTTMFCGVEGNIGGSTFNIVKDPGSYSDTTPGVVDCRTQPSWSKVTQEYLKVCSCNTKEFKLDASTIGAAAYNKINALKPGESVSGYVLMVSKNWGRGENPPSVSDGLAYSQRKVTFRVQKPAVCGNNVMETGEVCDGTSLNGKTCVTYGFDKGDLKCKSDCKGFDTSGCITLPKAVCGNEIIEGIEVCDGTNLDGKACTDFMDAKGVKYAEGTLKCTNGCAYDSSGCISKPTGVTIDLGSGKSSIVDFNEDGLDDVKVTLNRMNETDASITLDKL